MSELWVGREKSVKYTCEECGHQAGNPDDYFRYTISKNGLEREAYGSRISFRDTNHAILPCENYVDSSVMDMLGIHLEPGEGPVKVLIGAISPSAETVERETSTSHHVPRSALNEEHRKGKRIGKWWQPWAR